MKFFFPDSQDLVDPSFDFEKESRSELRIRHQDDQYAHEVFSKPPYDGILVSKAIVDGTSEGSGRYTLAQRHRFYRVGVREFFRLGGLEAGDHGRLRGLQLYPRTGPARYARAGVHLLRRMRVRLRGFRGSHHWGFSARSRQDPPRRGPGSRRVAKTPGDHPAISPRVLETLPEAEAAVRADWRHAGLEPQVSRTGCDGAAENGISERLPWAAWCR